MWTIFILFCLFWFVVFVMALFELAVEAVREWHWQRQLLVKQQSTPTTSTPTR